MKTFITHTADGIDSLQLVETELPGALCAGQIRVATKAASINYRDLMVISGQLGPAGPNGLIPISDAAGEVIEVAADVQRFKVGDRVILTHSPEWIAGPWRATTAGRGRGSPQIPGVMREQIVVHHSELVALPEHMSYEEGATLPCAGVTAWHALCVPVPLLPGMTVLLEGGGGVSTLGLQFAKLFGARVIVISSSPERCARLKNLGADEVIDYRAEPAWDKKVRELTSGIGVDLGIDIGGAETVDRTIASTRIGGRVALVGLLSGWPNTVSSMFSSSVDITPIKVGSRDDFEMMNRAIGFHKVHPVIDSSFSFEQLPDALRHLQGGKHFGKIVIKF